MGRPLGYWVMGNEKTERWCRSVGVGMWFCNYLISAPMMLYVLPSRRMRS